MDLKSLHNLGRVAKEFEIVKGLNVSLHTLSAMEQQKALAELPTSATGIDPAHRTVILQSALLIYALDTINGEKATLEQAKEFILGLQAPLFNEIYNSYDLIAREQDAAVEALKKK